MLHSVSLVVVQCAHSLYIIVVFQCVVLRMQGCNVLLIILHDTCMVSQNWFVRILKFVYLKQSSYCTRCDFYR